MRLQGLAVFVNFRLWACLGLVACATDAVGVDTCRKIEYARCDAASHCPGTFGAIDPGACRRFYRDHCLHGLPAADPGAKVNSCVGDIDSLGACAAQAQDSTPLTSCDPSIVSLDPAILTACALLSQPEKIKSCSFLSPPEDAGH
jgi:hypothetical protein